MSSEFDKIIGYESVKRKLQHITDMCRSPEIYEKLGVKPLKGLMLFGEPGLGKTALSEAFIKECGLPCITVRRNTPANAPDFSEVIVDAFREAEDNSIIFFDDLDKLSNNEEKCSDTAEFSVLQAQMDENSDRGIFVLATVNNILKLPKSLWRRFEEMIKLEAPTKDDARNIIKYYLSQKKVDENLDMEDVVRLIEYHSCAQLELIINKAALEAGYDRSDRIEMKHILEAVLDEEYGPSNGNFKNSPFDATERRKTAIHEAGHIVIAESLKRGSCGIACISSSSDYTGFVHLCEDVKRRPYYILIALGGKAATEMYYASTVANGCEDDLSKSFSLIRQGLSTTGSSGFAMLDVSNDGFDVSQEYLRESEVVTTAQLERFYRQARNILLKNKDLLEALTEALLDKQVLLFSDIQKIISTVSITAEAV